MTARSTFWRVVSRTCQEGGAESGRPAACNSRAHGPGVAVSERSGLRDSYRPRRRQLTWARPRDRETAIGALAELRRCVWVDELARRRTSPVCNATASSDDSLPKAPTRQTAVTLK